jgi:hypothetical protein
MEIHEMKPHVFLACLLFMLPGAYALSCTLDSAPVVHMNGDIQALCILNTTNVTDCYTWLSDPANSSDTWGAMPEEITIIPGVGAVQYFPVHHNVVGVTFSKDRLYQDVLVAGNVRCGAENFTFNFTPMFADYQSLVGEPLRWGAENTQYVAAALILLMFVLIVAGIVWRVTVK